MIERTTAKRYFDILIDTLIINSVDAFTKSKKLRLIQHQKYYFFDTGVLNGSLGNFTVSPDRIGLLLEHLFLQLIISHAKSHDKEIRITHYRTSAGAEVDFIVEYDNQVYAIEVKASKNIGSHNLTGLKSFAEFYKNPHEAIVVYLGEDNYERDGVQILPMLRALERICEN